MIQLRSALEELASVTLREDVVQPTWTRDTAVRELLDGDVRAELVRWGAAPGKKALFIGATWPELVIDLAREGMFVSVIDDDQDRIRAISEAAGDAGTLARVTVHTDPYFERQFESAGFNLIVAWDSLIRFDPWEPLLKKMVRELKTGGKLLVRSPVLAAPTTASEKRTARRLLRVALSLSSRVDSSVVAQDSFLMPDAFGMARDELVSTVEKLLVVEKQAPTHVFAPDVADLAAHVAPALQRILPKVLDRDERIIAQHPDRARFLTLWCAKERELGKVFRGGQTR